MRTLVFLHGVGDGAPDSAWRAGLAQAMKLQGRPAIDPGAIAAPRYDDILDTDGVAAKVPAITYRDRDDSTARRDFERRQAELFRRLSASPGVRGFGFGAVPAPVLHGLQQAGLRIGPSVIKQVNRYVASDEVRGAVLRRILSHLPSEGEIVLVAHSLGSVIAIDLLDHLSPALHVSRFVTLGSPANVDALHKGSDRLLKKFPYDRVDDWTNFLGHGDLIPGGRGLSSVFPGAQDFEVDIGVAHSAAKYLAQPSIAELVGEMMTDRPAIVAGSSSAEVVLRVTEDQENILLGLAYGHALAAHTDDEDAAERYRSALRIVQDGVLAQLQESAAASARTLPSEVTMLASGRPPLVSQRICMANAVLRLTALAESNLVAPYEIDTGEAYGAALQDVAGQLGFRPDLGKRVDEALAEVRDHTGRKGVPWGRVLTGAAGLALIAAGPVGLIVAAPASAFGAAAIVGGLAAFGPGGMVGGMALMGGLAAGGAAVATSAATVAHANVSAVDQAGVLLVRVAAQRALQMLDLPHDPEIWSAVANLETALGSQIARLRPFSDKKGPGLQDRERALALVVRLLGYMRTHGLGPAELEPYEESLPDRPARSLGERVSLRRIGRA